MEPWIWAIIVIAVLLAGAALYDRRARRRGHRLRSGKESTRDLGESRRDARARPPAGGDATWSHDYRRNHRH